MVELDVIAPDQRRIRRAEYDQMVAAGVFGEDRVELLHGIIVAMSPNDPPHASPVEILTEILVPALAGRARVRVQLPILAADESEPEPDIAIVPIGDYSRQHPSSAHLIVEVAFSSLRKDRLVKGPLYAKSGCAEYWIVDVRARVVEVHRGPSGDVWSSITRHGVGETLHPEAFADISVAVRDVIR